MQIINKPYTPNSKSIQKKNISFTGKSTSNSSLRTSKDTLQISFKGRYINGNYYTDQEIRDASRFKNVPNWEQKLSRSIRERGMNWFDYYMCDKDESHIAEVRKLYRDQEIEDLETRQRLLREENQRNIERQKALEEENKRAREAARRNFEEQNRKRIEQARRLEEERKRIEEERRVEEANRKRMEAEHQKQLEKARRIQIETRKRLEVEARKRIEEQNRLAEENLKKIQAEQIRIQNEIKIKEFKIEEAELKARIEKAATKSTGLDKIQGFEDQKNFLRLNFVSPIKLEKTKGGSFNIPNSIMLTGINKDQAQEVAEALSEETGCKFASIDFNGNHQETTDKICEEIGKSEENFTSKDKAKPKTRTLVLINNFDKLVAREGLSTHNDVTIAEMKSLLNDCSKELGCTFIFSTDDPSKIDSTVIRPERVLRVPNTTPIIKTNKAKKIDKDLSDEIKAHYKKVLEFLESNNQGDSLDAGYCHHYLGNKRAIMPHMHFGRLKDKKEKDHLEKAIKIYEKHNQGDSLDAALAHFSLGHLCEGPSLFPFNFFNHKEQISHYKKTLEILEKNNLGECLHAAYVYQTLGFVSNNKENAKKALALYEKHNEGDSLNAGMTHGYLGRIYDLNNEKKEAKLHLKKALALYEKHNEGDSLDAGKTHGYLGRIYDLNNEKKEAKLHLKKALALYEKHNEGDSLDAGKIHGYLGRIYDLNNEKKAKLHLKKALKILEKINSKDKDVLEYISNISIKISSLSIGEEKKYYLDKALKMNEQSHYKLYTSFVGGIQYALRKLYTGFIGVIQYALSKQRTIAR